MEERFSLSGSSLGTSLGVDFGTTSLKTAVVEQVASRVDILDATTLDVPTGYLQNGQIIEKKKLGKLLRESLRGKEIKPSSTVFSVPSSAATMRWVLVPKVNEVERRDLARFKVRRHLNYPVDEAYLVATEPASYDKEGQGHSMVICLPKEVVDSRAETLLYADLEPTRAELEAQAILRVVERKLNRESVMWRDASLTILDVGGSMTHMYVVQNQQLQFIRGVKFGVNLILEGMAKSLDVSKDYAHQLLNHPKTLLRPDGVLVCPNGEDVALVKIQDELEKLSREFLRLLRYFRSLHAERSYAGILDHVIICGGLAGLSGFANYLNKTLGLRVELARPVHGMMAKFNHESFLSIQSRQEAFAVVVGLALSGIQMQLARKEEEGYGSEFSWIRSA